MKPMMKGISSENRTLAAGLQPRPLTGLIQGGPEPSLETVKMSINFSKQLFFSRPKETDNNEIDKKHSLCHHCHLQTFTERLDF